MKAAEQWSRGAGEQRDPSAVLMLCCSSALSVPCPLHPASCILRSWAIARFGNVLTILERSRQLVRIDAEVDARLEAAEIQRRVYAAGGPAVLFTRVKGCRFPMVSNLFGTMERARFMFRDSLESVRRLVELKIDPERPPCGGR